MKNSFSEHNPKSNLNNFRMKSKKILKLSKLSNLPDIIPKSKITFIKPDPARISFRKIGKIKFQISIASPLTKVKKIINPLLRKNKKEIINGELNITNKPINEKQSNKTDILLHKTKLELSKKNIEDQLNHALNYENGSFSEMLKEYKASHTDSEPLLYELLYLKELDKSNIMKIIHKNSQNNTHNSNFQKLKSDSNLFDNKESITTQECLNTEKFKEKESSIKDKEVEKIAKFSKLSLGARYELIKANNMILDYLIVK